MAKLQRNTQEYIQLGKGRQQQLNEGLFGSYDKMLERTFEESTLDYLDERVINHLLDSLALESSQKDVLKESRNRFNDYSFLTAPAYKALEGFLFQIAENLNLPSSGNEKLAGSYYFDEAKIDKHVDKLLRELEDKAETAPKLNKYERQDIKDRIKEMKGFLQHYRHTPAHFWGEPIETIEKAHRNIQIIYGAIDNTTQILLEGGLIEVQESIKPVL